MQNKLSANRPSAPLPVSQDPTTAVYGELMKTSPTAKESERLLKTGNNSILNEPLPFTPSLQTHILLRDLHSTPSLRYVLRDLRAHNRGQTGSDAVLRTIVGFGHRTRERLTNTPPEDC